MYAQQSPDGVLETLQRETGKLPEFYLIDVGVSGGIHPVWRRWGAQLNAIGIDMLEKEVARLRREETNPKIFYEAAKISGQPPRPGQSGSNYSLHRSCAYMGTVLLAESGKPSAETAESYRARWRELISGSRFEIPIEANYRNVADPLADPFYRHYQQLFQKSIGLETLDYATDVASVDQIAQRRGWDFVDLLKIDTDGFDRDVLTGAEDLLEGRCLAVEIEVQFHGLDADDSNVFSEIDRFLRKRGYSLAKLDSYNYGRSALPRPFLYPDLPAQTKGGPIQWGDALYIRDPLRKGAGELSERQLVVLAALVDSYGLEDCAAEIILAFPDAFAPHGGRLLDALARKIHGSDYTYDRVITEFRSGVPGYRRP
jgi:hypothetical protein